MKRALFLFVVGLVMSGLVGCVSTGKYRRKSDEADALSKKLSAVNVEMEGVKKNLATTLTALKATATEKDKIIADLTAAKQEKEESVAKLKNTYENLVNDMKKEIKQGEILITQLQDKLTVNLVDKIIFDSGQSIVKENGRKILDRVGAILKKIDDKQIRIEGHTDNVPIGPEIKDRFPTNWELSTARATNVARYLIDKVGINPNLVSVTGYADQRPVATNDTEESRAKNRRIEIVLVPIEAVVVVPISPTK